MPHPTSTSLKRSAAPPSVDSRIAAFAARQHSLITYAQLCRVVTPGAITHRLKRGSLHRRYPTVYVVGQPKLSREGEWLAAALACDGVLSVRSCGVLHGGEPLPRGGDRGHDDPARAARRRARPHRPAARPARHHVAQGHPGHDDPPAARRLHRRAHAAPDRQRHPQGGVPRALRRARRARRDGARARAAHAGCARARDRAAPHGQRGHEERRGGCVPAARAHRAAREHGAARLRGRLPLARAAAGGGGRRSASTRCGPTPTRRAIVCSTTRAGPSLRFSDREVYEQPSGVRALLDAMADGDDRVDRRQQLAAELRQRVLDRRW